MQEVVSQLRGRIAELEAAAQQQQRALATARHQNESLEARLAATELAAARSAAEVGPQARLRLASSGRHVGVGSGWAVG